MSLSAHLHSRRLRYPLLVLHPRSQSTSSSLPSSFEPLAAAGDGLPCDLSLVNTRVLALRPLLSVALFVHRVAFDCSIAVRTRVLNTECRADGKGMTMGTLVSALFGKHSPTTVRRTTLNALETLDNFQPNSALNVGKGHIETYKLEF